MLDTCNSPISPTVSDSLGMWDKLGNKFVDLEATVNNMGSLMLSLCLSAAAIAVIYLFKFRLIAKNPASSIWLGAVAEYPIDLCVTLIPIIAVGTVESEHPYFGIILILISIIVIYCAYKLRGQYFKLKNSGGKAWYHLFMLANYILTGIFIGIVVELIIHSWKK